MTSTEEIWKSWLCDLEEEDNSFINSIEESFQHDEQNLLGCFSQMTDPHILAFNNQEHQESMLKPKSNKIVNQKKEPKKNIEKSKETDSDSLTRSPYDHIIAERKRREKISQQFIALSALIPGLKKVDKASILGDTIKHVKQLQEQVKHLEVMIQKEGVESAVYVEKSKSSLDNDVSVTLSNSRDNSKNQSMPEVELRVTKKNVLIRIHCEKQEGVLMNIIKEIENLHLSVTSSSTLHFGTSKLDITIIAVMKPELSLSVQDVARRIRMAVFQLM